VNEDLKYLNLIAKNVAEHLDKKTAPVDETVYALLQKIRNRYVIYIGEKSLKSLLAFIYGYMECMRERDNTSPAFLGIEFQSYIANLYGIAKPHWSDIIRLNSKTEEEAFDKFYEHMEQFLRERNQ
jgi:hypothetical protein